MKSNALLNFNTLKKVVLSILKLAQGFYGDSFSKNRIRKRISYGFSKEIDNIFKAISFLISKNKTNWSFCVIKTIYFLLH